MRLDHTAAVLCVVGLFVGTVGPTAVEAQTRTAPVQIKSSTTAPTSRGWVRQWRARPGDALRRMRAQRAAKIEARALPRPFSERLGPKTEHPSRSLGTVPGRNPAGDKVFNRRGRQIN
jgi:hypothetical protein